MKRVITSIGPTMVQVFTVRRTSWLSSLQFPTRRSFRKRFCRNSSSITTFRALCANSTCESFVPAALTSGMAFVSLNQPYNSNKQTRFPICSLEFSKTTSAVSSGSLSTQTSRKISSTCCISFRGNTSHLLTLRQVQVLLRDRVLGKARRHCSRMVRRKAVSAQ